MNLIDPQPDDTIITLVDYVDRGLDYKCVLDLLNALQSRCTDEEFGAAKSRLPITSNLKA